MATASNFVAGPPVSVEEYIKRFVDGDEKPTCEYVDGELIPKPLATRNHGIVQMTIGHLILGQYGSAFIPVAELSTRVAVSKFLVPDIAVEERSKPHGERYPGPNDPVYLCIEILSPPDRLGKLWGKCEVYHEWGVPYCWVLDPDLRRAWEYYPNDLEPRRVENKVTAGAIELDLSDVFRDVITYD